MLEILVEIPLVLTLPNVFITASKTPILLNNSNMNSSIVRPRYIRYRVLEEPEIWVFTLLRFGLSASGLPSLRLLIPKAGRIETAKIIIPKPPIQWVTAFQSTMLHGKSSLLITEQFVVVNPAVDSKIASPKEATVPDK